MTQHPPSPKQQVQALFNGLASRYDSTGPSSFGYFGRVLVERAQVEAGHTVLDVATGRGAVLYPAAEKTGPQGQVLGIDIAEHMVAEARQEVAQRHLDAQVEVMDAEHLSLPDASFDRVLCGFGIMFLPDREKALAEFRRVLKPGGRIGVSTWQQSNAEDVLGVVKQLGGVVTQPPGWITEPDRLRDALIATGFSNVEVMVDEHTFVFRDLEQYWEHALTTGASRAIDSLKPEQIDPAKQALADRLASCKRSDGLHITFSALIATAAI